MYCYTLFSIKIIDEEKNTNKSEGRKRMKKGQIPKESTCSCTIGKEAKRVTLLEILLGTVGLGSL